jgi:hypothetical protein
MEIKGPSETLVSIYKTTWHHIPEDPNTYIHSSENLTFHKNFVPA